MTLCVFPPFYYSYSYENIPARHPCRQVGITIALSTVILAAEEKNAPFRHPRRQAGIQSGGASRR